MSINRRLPSTITSRINSGYNLLNATIAKGTADIDISAAVYTAYVTLLTITPEALNPMYDLQIDLAYNKATTGVSAVATNADTLNVQVFGMADDATESRLISGSAVTLTGDVSPLLTGERFLVGTIDGAVTVKVKLSAERADAEIPYKVTYRSAGTPTITAVAAG